MKEVGAAQIFNALFRHDVVSGQGRRKPTFAERGDSQRDDKVSAEKQVEPDGLEIDQQMVLARVQNRIQGQDSNTDSYHERMHTQQQEYCGGEYDEPERPVFETRDEAGEEQGEQGISPDKRRLVQKIQSADVHAVEQRQYKAETPVQPDYSCGENEKADLGEEDGQHKQKLEDHLDTDPGAHQEKEREAGRQPIQ